VQPCSAGKLKDKSLYALLWSLEQHFRPLQKFIKQLWREADRVNMGDTTVSLKLVWYRKA